MLHALCFKNQNPLLAGAWKVRQLFAGQQVSVALSLSRMRLYPLKGAGPVTLGMSVAVLPAQIQETILGTAINPCRLLQILRVFRHGNNGQCFYFEAAFIDAYETHLKWWFDQ